MGQHAYAFFAKVLVLASPRVGNLLVQPLVDSPDLGSPALPLTMLHLHNLVVGPVQIVGQVRYLLVQAIEGVAHYSPTPAVSTSNSP